MSLDFATLPGSPVRTIRPIPGCTFSGTPGIPTGTIGTTLGEVSRSSLLVVVGFPGKGEWHCHPDDLAIVTPGEKDAPAGPFDMLPGLTDQEATEIAQRWDDPGTFAARQMLKQAYALGASRAQAQAFQGIQPSEVVG